MKAAMDGDVAITEETEEQRQELPADIAAWVAEQAPGERVALAQCFPVRGP